LRKALKKVLILIIIISFYAAKISAEKNEIIISGYSISKISPSVFLLNYSIKNSYNPDAFSDIPVIIPFEEYIIQGTIEKGILPEKDFLFSQTDIDLNGDGDFDDLYSVKAERNTITINNKSMSLLTKTTSTSQVLLPFINTGHFNFNKFSDKARPFTLKSYSVSPLKITIGFTPDNDIEFKKFKNSLLCIEVITQEKNFLDNILINGEKPFMGITNEKEVAAGEKSERFVVSKNVTISNGTAKGEIKIDNIMSPFSVRLTYYFGISENSVLMSQKVIRVD
jgi:hypothetical protein